MADYNYWVDIWFGALTTKDGKEVYHWFTHKTGRYDDSDTGRFAQKIKKWLMDRYPGSKDYDVHFECTVRRDDVEDVIDSMRGGSLVNFNN
mgnify:CR=1 FL=1